MSQSDWIGNLPPPPPFKDIKRQRPSVAEEKATLCLQLGRLMNTIPPRVANGSIQVVREWRHKRDQAAKVAGNKRSTVPELSKAIAQLAAYL